MTVHTCTFMHTYIAVNATMADMMTAAGKLWDHLNSPNRYDAVREVLTEYTQLDVPDFSSEFKVTEFLSKWCDKVSVTIRDFDKIFARIEERISAE